MNINELTTPVSLAFIAIVFLYYAYELLKFYIAARSIRKIQETDNPIDSINGTKLQELGEVYKKTIDIVTPNGDKKTNIPSISYFNEDTVTKAHKINLRMLDSASGTLVGLGLLGTFLGLTVGISGFDSSDSSNIQKSIQNLLGGMSTAFITSLLGMFLSLVYTTFDKIFRNRLHKNLYYFTEKLDALYFIDDNKLHEIKHKELVGIITKAIQNEFETKLMYSNQAGENVTIGNAIREILAENEEQSKALKSFSTDLAIELNNGFDEVLSRQMQEKILPLMESVDATTRAVIEHIDQMASVVASPASGMMESVVDELKKSMTAIVDEFKTNLSSSTTSQLEKLALQLGTASQTMGDFPKNMENISATLQATITEVKNAISDISQTSENANSVAMQKMQEQIAFATGSISEAITEVKDVMDAITHSSQEQNTQMLAKLSDTTEKIGNFLDKTIMNLSSSVKESMKSITDDVSNKQADLIALQEDTTTQTKKLLEAFNDGLDRLTKMNESVSGTMNVLKQAQGEISISTGNLRTISSDMKLATELFNKGQNDYAEKLTQLQLTSQNGINQIEELLLSSGQMTDEYVKKFELIKQGLGTIFTQLQNGLTEYSRTVQETTQKYLDQYSSSLTQTTDALSSTIQQQNEVIEALNETLSKRR